MAGADQFRIPSEQDSPKGSYRYAETGAPITLFAIAGFGNGIQSVYLTEVPMPLAELLIGLIGREAALLNDRAARSTLQTPMQLENTHLEMWEHHIESEIESDRQLLETEREALIVARRGQGLFKQRVMQVENRCRITGVTNPIHLRASHCNLGGIQALRSGSTAKTDFC
jgi:putative restriction endonuclease